MLVIKLQSIWDCESSKKNQQRKGDGHAVQMKLWLWPYQLYISDNILRFHIYYNFVKLLLWFLSVF